MSDDGYSNIEQQVIALAGVAQAARLVDQISKTGSYPVEFLEPSIHSLFEFDADSVEQVFGGIAGVKLGLHNLSGLLVSEKAQEHRVRKESAHGHRPRQDLPRPDVHHRRTAGPQQHGGRQGEE